MGQETAKVLPDYETALARALGAAPVLGTERVGLGEALGRVLRADVRADRDQPPFDRATMDGFAVAAGDVAGGKSFEVVGSVSAGGTPEAVRRGGVVRIATGAAMPAGADAVVPIEQAKVEGVRVAFTVSSAKVGQYVHHCAGDAKAGAVVLAAGTRLGPAHVGIAAAVGAVELEVSKRPRATVLTTGDEVMPPEMRTDRLRPEQIRNSNGPMLAGLLSRLGVELLACEHLPDEPERTLAAAREAMSHSHLVVTNGGVSVGERDFLPWAWKRLGLATVIQGVAIQPGRPVLVMGDGGEEPPFDKLAVGLPGNPVSVLATAHLFVWPLVMRMTGENGGLRWRAVELRQAVKARSDRQVFRAAKLDHDGGATVIQWQGSGDLMHTAGAEAWVRLPLTDEPVPAGTRVAALEMLR